MKSAPFLLLALASAPAAAVPYKATALTSHLGDVDHTYFAGQVQEKAHTEIHTSSSLDLKPVNLEQDGFELTERRGSVGPDLQNFPLIRDVPVPRMTIGTGTPEEETLLREIDRIRLWQLYNKFMAKHETMIRRVNALTESGRKEEACYTLANHINQHHAGYSELSNLLTIGSYRTLKKNQKYMYENAGHVLPAFDDMKSRFVGQAPQVQDFIQQTEEPKRETLERARSIVEESGDKVPWPSP